MEGLLRSPALNPRVPGVLATGSDARSQFPLTGVGRGLSPIQRSLPLSRTVLPAWRRAAQHTAVLDVALLTFHFSAPRTLFPSLQREAALPTPGTGPLAPGAEGAHCQHVQAAQPAWPADSGAHPVGLHVRRKGHPPPGPCGRRPMPTDHFTQILRQGKPPQKPKLFQPLVDEGCVCCKLHVS